MRDGPADGKQQVEDFEAFYAATHRSMLRTLTAVTGNAQEAQDCVQEAYVRAATS